MKLRALVAVVLTMALAACTSSQTLVPTTTRVPVTTQPLPALDISVTPTGWEPVALGDAQLSVPATWWVLYNGPYCPAGKTPGELFVNPYLTACTLEIAGDIPANRVALYLGLAFSPEHHKAEVINGFAVYMSYQDYDVPSLGVTISADGPLARRVLDTLARSPRSVVLASGLAPGTQRGWRTASFAGLTFAVPGSWKLVHTEQNYGFGLPCASAGAFFFSTEVFLSTDERPPNFKCAMLPGPGSPRFLRAVAKVPQNGLHVDAGVLTLSQDMTGPEAERPAFSRRCLALHSLTICPASSPAYSVFVLRVTVPGRAAPVYLSIGLAGNGTVARTILDSLRAA